MVAVINFLNKLTYPIGNQFLLYSIWDELLVLPYFRNFYVIFHKSDLKVVPFFRYWYWKMY